jgi:hypothetical protein
MTRTSSECLTPGLTVGSDLGNAGPHSGRLPLTRREVLWCTVGSPHPWRPRALLGACSEASSPGRWARNQATASSATRSRAPGSGNRWLAPGTTSSRARPANPSRAARLSANTVRSRPPTTSNVGARTRPRTAPARSGRPPRETTAATAAGRSAATSSAAPAPVLAPNRPTGRPPVRRSVASQSSAAASRPASSWTSKRRRPPARSAVSSSAVSRSSSRFEPCHAHRAKPQLNAPNRHSDEAAQRPALSGGGLRNRALTRFLAATTTSRTPFSRTAVRSERVKVTLGTWGRYSTNRLRTTA